MQAKFGFYSNVSPRHDYTFTLDVQDKEDAYFIEQDLNRNLADGYVRFVNIIKPSNLRKQGKHEKRD